MRVHRKHLCTYDSISLIVIVLGLVSAVTGAMYTTSFIFKSVLIISTLIFGYLTYKAYKAKK